jgi:hypothetical protein
MAVYVDTSALVKLVVAEPETQALRAWLAEHEPLAVANDLARVELLRTVSRAAPQLTIQARAVLDAMVLTRLTVAVLEEAGRLQPATLRTLAAIHLASALELGDDLEALLTYDERLAQAATLLGITVHSPA